MPWICSSWQVNWTAIAACIALTVFVVDVIRRWRDRKIAAQLLAVTATPEIWEARARLKEALRLIDLGTPQTVPVYSHIKTLIAGARLDDLDALRPSAGALPLRAARAFVFAVRRMIQLQRMIDHPNFKQRIAAAGPGDVAWGDLRVAVADALKYIEGAAVATWGAARFDEDAPINS